MKHYARYICISMFVPLLMITLTLTGVVWLSQASRFVDMIVNRGLDLSTFLYLTGLLIPSLLLVILPVALFCAAMFVYYRMTMDSELVVMQNAGLSRYALVKPMLIIGGLITIICYSISLYFSPAAYREFKDLQYFIRDNYASVLLEEGVFNNPVDGLTVYVDERDGEFLKGILVHDNRIAERPITMMAKEGKLYQTPEGPHFQLLQGNRQEVNYEKSQLSLLYFEQYDLNLRFYVEKQSNRWRRPKERFLHELIFLEDMPDHVKGKFYAEAHQRLTWPLYSLLLPLIATIALLRGEFNRRGNWKRLVISSVVGLVTVFGGISLINMSAHIPSIFMIVYLYFFIVIAGAFYLLLNERTFRFSTPFSPIKNKEDDV